MQVKATVFALAGLLAASASASGIGRSLTSWDCCKPACAWSSTLSRSGSSGSVKVCGKDDRPLSASQGASVQSSCGEGRNQGNGYLCSDYSPRPVSNELSYGFAVTKDSTNCCKCFEVRWVDGPAKGKRMQLQSINTGGSVDDGLRDFIILMPGGGVGPNPGGCSSQFGGEWGRQYGGVTQVEDCERLPSHLQGGCYWRWNWARGDINDWPVEWDNITCPDYLTTTSGCKPT